MAADPDDTPEVSYAAALDELEQILVELDDDQLDVDVVAERVQRAAALIRVCRARIAGARMQVERVVADLEADDGSMADASLAEGDQA